MVLLLAVELDVVDAHAPQGEEVPVGDHDAPGGAATAALVTLVTLLDEMTMLLLPLRTEAAPLGGVAAALCVFALWGPATAAPLRESWAASRPKGTLKARGNTSAEEKHSTTEQHQASAAVPASGGRTWSTSTSTSTVASAA